MRRTERKCSKRMIGVERVRGRVGEEFGSIGLGRFVGSVKWEN